VEKTDDLLVDTMDENIFYQIRQDCDGIIKEIYEWKPTPENPYYNPMYGQYRDGIDISHNLNIVLDYIHKKLN